MQALNSILRLKFELCAEVQLALNSLKTSYIITILRHMKFNPCAQKNYEILFFSPQASGGFHHVAAHITSTL